MMGAPARRYNLAAGAVVAATVNGAYRGRTVRETAGSTAVVKVHQGGSATGALLDTISLAANGSSTVLDAEGVRFDGGVFIEIVSGTVEGSVFLA